jgi:hypothetical protein
MNGFFILAIATFLLPLISLDPLSAKDISLNIKHFVSVPFEKIPPTRFSNAGSNLLMEVDKSSAFLLLPFKELTPVREVSFDWRGDGKLNVKDAAEEMSKLGDDFRLRVGLIEHGPAPFFSFFAPAWVKTISKSLLFPTNHLTYIVVDSKNTAGKIWQSPYAKEIELIACKSQTTADGWQSCRYQFQPPLSVVGLWLMADGDNTASIFSTTIQNLSLK